MNDEHLDEAARALREETASDADGGETLGRVDGEATLARVLASLDGESLLDDAARALRSETMGDADGATTLDRVHATLDGESALPLTVRGPQRDRGKATRALPWLAVAAAALLAVALGGPTALAWWRGAIAAVRGWTQGEERHERETERHAAPAPRSEPSASPSTPAPTPMPTRVPTPTAARPAPSARPIARAARERVMVGDPDVAPSVAPPIAVAPDDGSLAERAERALFEDAQHVHFGGGASRDAVAGWDRYLAAYPDGRYTPEARYNRALALVRAGRLDDARDALRPIAAAGGYRAAEASALLDAIAARQ